MAQGSSQTDQPQQKAFISWDPLDENRFIIAYKDGTPPAGGTGYPRAVVGTISGTTISLGTPVDIDTDSDSSPCCIHFHPDVADLVAVAYGADYIGTKSPILKFGMIENAPTERFVAKSVLNMHLGASYGSSVPHWEKGSFAFDWDRNSSGLFREYCCSMDCWFDFAGATNYRMPVIRGGECETDGGTYNAGTWAAPRGLFTAGNYQWGGGQIKSLRFDPNTHKKFLYVHHYPSGGGGIGHALRIVNLDSNNYPNQGSEIQLTGQGVDNSDDEAYCEWNPAIANQIVFSGKTYNPATMCVGTVSGTSVSWGTRFTPTATNTSSSHAWNIFFALGSAAGRFYGVVPVQAYPSTDMVCQAFDITGTTITEVGSPVTIATHNWFDNTLTYPWHAAVSPSGRKFIVSHLESSGDTKLTTGTIGSTGITNLTADNFLGVSDGAYSSGATATIQLSGATDDAQSGLTTGSTYYVQPNGSLATTAATPAVFAGQALSATELLIAATRPGVVGSQLPLPGTTGRILESDGTNWISGTAPTTLPATGASGKILTSDGSNWISADAPTEVPAPGTSGKILTSDGSNWTSADAPTELPAPGSAGKVLKSDGSNWISGDEAELPAAGTSGYVLTSDGSNWTSAAGATGLPAAGATGRLLTSDGSNWISAEPDDAFLEMAPAGGEVTATAKGAIVTGDPVVLLSDGKVQKAGMQPAKTNIASDNNETTYASYDTPAATSFPLAIPGFKVDFDPNDINKFVMFYRSGVTAQTVTNGGNWQFTSGSTNATFNGPGNMDSAIVVGAVLTTSGAGWLPAGCAVAAIVSSTPGQITLTAAALGSGQVTPVTFTFDAFPQLTSVIGNINGTAITFGPENDVSVNTTQAGVGVTSVARVEGVRGCVKFSPDTPDLLGAAYANEDNVYFRAGTVDSTTTVTTDGPWTLAAYDGDETVIDYVPSSTTIADGTWTLNATQGGPGPNIITKTSGTMNSSIGVGAAVTGPTVNGQSWGGWNVTAGNPIIVATWSGGVNLQLMAGMSMTFPGGGWAPGGTVIAEVITGVGVAPAQIRMSNPALGSGWVNPISFGNGQFFPAGITVASVDSTTQLTLSASVNGPDPAAGPVNFAVTTAMDPAIAVGAVVTGPTVNGQSWGAWDLVSGSDVISASWAGGVDLELMAGMTVTASGGGWLSADTKIAQVLTGIGVAPAQMKLDKPALGSGSVNPLYFTNGQFFPEGIKVASVGSNQLTLDAAVNGPGEANPVTFTEKAYANPATITWHTQHPIDTSAQFWDMPFNDTAVDFDWDAGYNTSQGGPGSGSSANQWALTFEHKAGSGDLNATHYDKNRHRIAIGQCSDDGQSEPSGVFHWNYLRGNSGTEGRGQSWLDGGHAQDHRSVRWDPYNAAKTGWSRTGVCIAQPPKPTGGGNQDGAFIRSFLVSSGVGSSGGLSHGTESYMDTTTTLLGDAYVEWNPRVEEQVIVSWRKNGVGTFCIGTHAWPNFTFGTHFTHGLPDTGAGNHPGAPLVQWVPWDTTGTLFFAMGGGTTCQFFEVSGTTITAKGDPVTMHTVSSNDRELHFATDGASNILITGRGSTADPVLETGEDTILPPATNLTATNFLGIAK